MRAKPIIIFLSLMGIAVLLYFYKQKKSVAAAIAQLPTTPEPAQPVTGVEKQIIADTKGLSKLSPAKIKQYATWIDRIEQILAAYRKATGDKYGKPTTEAVANATALGLLGYDDLLAVVNYWESVRKRKVLTALSMFTDTTDKLSGLVRKLKNYKIIK